MRIFSIATGIAVTLLIAGLVAFVAVNAAPMLSLELFFADTKPFDAIFRGAIVWEGLYNPLMGSIRLVLLAGLFAIPMGVALGIFTAEFTGKASERRLVAFLESLAGIPSIIAGLFGFVLILFLRNFIPARTCLLLAAFCLAVLVLPVLALYVYNALKAVPQDLRLSAASLGIGRYETTLRLVIPRASEGIISGLLLAAGRCAEDTAVILMTGAVAQAAGAHGLFAKFEALPFFIYYTSANYRDEAELAMVFAAALILLLITFCFMTAGSAFGRRAFR